MKKMLELQTKEEMTSFWDKTKLMRSTTSEESVKLLIFEINEAKEQIEAGEYISLDDVFDRVIAKYEE
ncbi:MAG: hypothetical protein ACOZBX_06315 [Campylobacterota bacterium]